MQGIGKEGIATKVIEVARKEQQQELIHGQR
jgi:hypothetical protein